VIHGWKGVVACISLFLYGCYALLGVAKPLLGAFHAIMGGCLLA